MAKLNLIETIQTKLSTLTKKDGQLIIVRDNASLYVDLDESRIYISDWIDISTDEERLAMISPLSNKYYYVVETNKIWRYISGSWILISSINDLNEHIEDTDIHITSTERTNWNDANSKKHSHSNKSVLDGITSALITTWNNAATHISDTIKHITSTERTNWGTAYTHSQSAHAPSGAEVNQNAFSNIVVGTTTISADSKTDSLTLVAGSNVTLTPDATNDKITIAATDTVYTHPDSGVTAGNYAGVTVDAKGHVTAGNATLPISQGGTGQTSIANIYRNVICKSGANTSPEYVVGFDTSYANNGYVSIKDLRNTMGLGNTTDALPISNGGTGATDAATARTNLGITPANIGAATTATATTSANGLMTAAMVTKLNGIATGANAYTHPSYTAKSSGLYKITVDASGHVSATTTVAKADITGLGIPAQDTTYSNFIKSGSSAKAGLVPAPSTTAGTTKYLREDGTWSVPPDNNTTYSNMTAATSSAAGKAGLVPAPTAGAQGKFLRGDGTWQTPTNTTYSNFVKSGSGAAAGLVPAPSTTAGTTKYLREDGTWAVPPDTNTTYSKLSQFTNDSGYITGITKAMVTTALGYTPPTSDTDTHYTSHLYVGASGGNANATSATSNPYLLCVDNTTNRNSIQLKAGSNMAISATNGVVTFTATNTTYNAASTSAAGLMSAADKTKLDGIATGANNYTYTLPTASSSTLGGVKTTSTVTSTSGLTACPIISGVPYYKDTNTTYSLSSFGITATAAELNVLDGITATVTELNYCDGVTSNIQTQLNGKAASSHGTHVTFSTTAPVVAGTASVGSATTVARSDHKHPAQTSVSGSSGSCTGNSATATSASSSASTVTTSCLRNIQASTTDLTAGTSALTTGAIYVVYE